MKRSVDQRLAERLGIKLIERTGPHQPGNGSLWTKPWFSYRFLFTTLVRATKHTQKTRPGAQFYGTGFGETSDAEAWTRALEQFSTSIRPSARP